MSIFFTDLVVFVDIQTDENGVKTKYESTPQKARVESFNNLVTDNRGQEVMADMIIFTDSNAITEFTDKVKILRKGGVAYYDPEKEWLIKKMPIIHNFSAHHKELYI